MPGLMWRATSSVVVLTAVGAGIWPAASVAGQAPAAAPRGRAHAPHEGVARQLLDAAGVRGGLVVHLGCGDGALTAALRASDSYLVHGLDADPANVAKARAHIRSRGLQGKVAVEHWTAPFLPYADSLVNAVVASGECPVPSEEIARVLAPRGVLLAKEGSLDTRHLTLDTAASSGLQGWTKATKPVPQGIDDWTHALYDATNNAVASDRVVGPPHHVQWVGAPRNARHHERLASITVVVSAGGRLFYVADEAPAASVLLRPAWSLIARDGFSGVVLWKRPIPTWEPHLRGFRSGPPELARRLVASGDRVYATLGLGAPVSVLDAATGRTVATCPRSEGAEEILHEGGILWLVVGRLAASGAAGSRERSIVAVDAGKGRVLWERRGAGPQPSSLAVGGGRAVYLAEGAVVALDAKTGRELWRTERAVARKRPGWSSATLVVHGDVVLCADRQATPASNLDESTGRKIAAWLAEGGYPGDLVAYAAATGEKLWTCRCAEGYHAPVDVFAIDGLVWAGQSRARTGPDFTLGRDLRTGKVVRRIASGKAYQTTMPHHRCHRNRATSRYIVGGRTGVEFIDVATGRAYRHHWTRGTCQFGVLPSNGLLYCPPHSCACYIEAKLAGFYALAPKRDEGRGTRDEQKTPRLERGPAFSSSLDTRHSTLDTSDWPTYRHDAARSGCAGTSVPVGLGTEWTARVGGRLSSPVVAEGMALVAEVDGHTVHALDAATGKPAWRVAAGGRVDSPPSVSRGLAVFGSADGWVRCVRVSDGRLAWRFRAAPRARRIVAFGQVESAWPVHGSVLIRDGVVYCAAGRTSYLDGGIHVYRLDLGTGKVLAQRRLYSRDPETGEQPDEPMMFHMTGALPDVLSSGGDRVYMRRLALDAASLAPREPRRHLYSPAGFLNGDWWHRTYWIYGTHFYSGYIGWYFAGRENAAGRLLSVGDGAIYGFAYKPSYYRGSTGRDYHLFAADTRALPDPGPPDYARAHRDYPHSGGGKFKVPFTWRAEVPLLGRAMVLAGDTLFLAGPPRRALRSPAIFQGRQGGMLCAVSAADGSSRAVYRLDALPVHDGMAAAGGRLYVSMADGTLRCLGAGPGHRPLAAWAAPDQAPAGKPREPGLAGHWALDDGAGAVAADSSGLGNDAEVNGQWVRGDFGTCVLTKGVPGAVTVWDGAAVRFGTGSFTVACWVKADGYGRRLLGKEDFPRSWWVINVLDDGRAELVLGTGREVGKSVRPTSRTPLSRERWTHVAFAVDRERGQVRCYINGAPDGTARIPGKLTGSLSVEGKDLMIPSARKPFVGLIDELKLYRRALADAEVKADWQREHAKRTSAAWR